MLFQWTALSPGQFRLLKKRRPLPDGQLSYELYTATAQRAPLYAVVSYTRSSAPKDQPVLVNGRTLTVSKCAYTALQEATDLGECDYFWIDCLSIHESDAEEKARQERALEGIYGAADCVYICQGSSEEVPEVPAIDRKTRVVVLRHSL